MFYLMKFFEALVVANQKEELIGKLIINGATLDEVIIAPSNAIDYQRFITSYIDTLDAQKSIAPYIEADVKVLGVFDKIRIRQDNAFLISEI